MSARVLFVAGSHTEIGKTHVACGLLRAALQDGLTADALKPVVSGFDAVDWADSDPGRILAALERPLALEALEQVSPWRYLAPLAPPLAAKAEGAVLDFDPIAAFCRRRIAETRADLIVVEGVGGLMSPIADGATSLDLLEALPGRTLLVSGAYLGAVSHTLTALEVMRVRGLQPMALVVSECADPDAPSMEGTLELLSQHTQGITIIPAFRKAGDAWANLALKAALR